MANTCTHNSIIHNTFFCFPSNTFCVFPQMINVPMFPKRYLNDSPTFPNNDSRTFLNRDLFPEQFPNVSSAILKRFMSVFRGGENIEKIPQLYVLICVWNLDGRTKTTFSLFHNFHTS